MLFILFGFLFCVCFFVCDKVCRNVGIMFFLNFQNYMFFRVKIIIKVDEIRCIEVFFVLMLVYEIRNEFFFFKDLKKYLEVL